MPRSIQRFASCCRALAVLELVGHVPAALAANPPTWVGSGTPAERPDATHSYVVTSDKVNLWDGVTTYGGGNYPASLAAFPGATVDVVMQECFGGGFAKGLAAEVNKPWTFAASTNWNEVAWNTQDVPPRNFTNSWAASMPPVEGFYQHYQDATSGALAVDGPPSYDPVQQDPFSPGGIFYKQITNPKKFEDPSFASPDALVGGNANPAGANNARGIIPADTFAVLVATQPDATRFGQNIDSVYDGLRTLGVAANHIAILYGDKSNTSKTPGGNPINGPITLTNFQAATSGNLGAASVFGNVTGQTKPAAVPATSHLFVYDTGHGNSWTPKGGTTVANPSGTSISVTEKPGNGFTDAAGSDPAVDDDFTLELAFTRPFDPTGVTVTFDDLALSPPTDAGTNGQTDLSPMIGAPLYYWDVAVPVSFYDLAPTAAGPYDSIQINGLSTDDLVAVTYDDFGDSWSVGIPEPATGFLAAALVAFCRRRRRS